MRNVFRSGLAPSLRLWLALLCTLAGLSTGQLASTVARGQVHASARTLHVATTGGDSTSCGSAGAPCRTIHYAAGLAASGDTILVAGGTYTYNAAVDTCSFLVTRAVVCFVDKHLTILGGYSTSNWSDANPVARPTVIDGQNARRGVAVIAFNTTASLDMQGFTIQNGLAQGAASGGDFFIGGYGGGIWAQNGSLRLRDMIFRNNRAIGGTTGAEYGGAGAGGGVAITSPKNGAGSILERVSFEGNQALGGGGPVRGGLALGGGLFTYEALVSGSGLQFANNRATAGSSAGSGTSAGLQADALGGAAAFQQRSTVTLRYVSATGNQSLAGNAASAGGNAFGGAFYAEEAAVTVSDSLLRDNAIRGGNAATGGVALGGGIMTYNASFTLDRVQVIACVTTSGSSTSGGASGRSSGGGVYVATVNNTSQSLNVANSVFADNRNVLGTGGSTQGGGGAGLVVQAQLANISHSTFARNTLGPGLGSGQGILVQGSLGGAGTPGVANISYSILAEHTGTAGAPALQVERGSTANLTRGLFAGNTRDSNATAQAGTINGLATMITAASPGFVAPGGPAFNYHISANSPARDQAAGSTLPIDVDGHGRPAGAARDIGADEYVVLDRVVRIPLALR